MMTRSQQSVAAADGAAEFDEASEGLAPIPQLMLHAFCATADTAAAVQDAAGDRRMNGARVRIRMGGIASAIEAFRNAPTPDVLLIESGMDGEEVAVALDELAQVCDAATRVIVISPAYEALQREALRREVSDYLVMPLEPRDVVRAVSRLFGGPGSYRPGAVASSP